MELPEGDYEKLLGAIVWDEKAKANSSKIIQDMIMFGKATWDSSGNHVPLNLPSGECEICAAQKNNEPIN